MHKPFRALSRCLGLLASLLAAAGEGPESTEGKELHDCRRNLRVISEAFQAYRRAHRELPNSLGELQPRFLSEGRFLICPAARRLGLTSADATKWSASGQTTYGYEFSPTPIPGIMSGGSSRSMREWKRLQMGLIGSEVPIVRCHTHEHTILNLSFGGRIYESSSLDWERVFEDVVDVRELWHARRLRAQVVTKTIVVPRRDPQARPALIDLSDHYNLSLAEAWWPEGGSLRPLAGLTPGLVEGNGVGFDVRGALQLGARRPGWVHYPTAISNIVIHLPGRGVHLLVGAVHAVAGETSVAACVFHLADGRPQRFKLHYGRHVAACVSKPGERFGLPTDSQMAWTAVTAEAYTVRLYQCQWINPFPEQLIERMDFLAQDGDAAPFLVAMSVDQGL